MRLNLSKPLKVDNQTAVNVGSCIKETQDILVNLTVPGMFLRDWNPDLYKDKDSEKVLGPKLPDLERSVYIPRLQKRSILISRFKMFKKILGVTALQATSYKLVQIP